jgi:carbonic anhydrase
MHLNDDHALCRCGELLQFRANRRRFLEVAAIGGLAAALTLPASGAEGKYEAMALTCIDPRFQAPVFNYLKGRGLAGQYSQFTIAGAAIGVVAPTFKDWHKAFWDNLAITMQLHHITRVIVIDHRDCGAAKVAYGDASVANPTIETQTHKKVLAEFRKQLAQRQPSLTAETGLMDLDGKFTLLG